jgi:hypothetical protein
MRSSEATRFHFNGPKRMSQKFEYKFVRLGEGWWGATSDATHSYQQQVHQHAREGWRLVQVFAPGTGVYGGAKFFELIFERPVDE